MPLVPRPLLRTNTKAVRFYYFCINTFSTIVDKEASLGFQGLDVDQEEDPRT